MKQTDPAKTWNRPLRWLRFLPTLGWMSVIYILSSRTGDEINTMLPFFQKFLPFMNDFNWGHFVLYFVLDN